MDIHFLGLSFRQRRSVWSFPCSLLALVMLLLGPLGTKFGFFDYQLGLLILATAFFLSVLILVVELVIFVWRIFFSAASKAVYDLLPIFLGLFVFLIVFIQLVPALSAPVIHNISTNTEPAPQFDKVVVIRESLGSNPLEYRFSPMNARLQKQAYSKLLPHVSNLRAEDLIKKVERVLKGMDMEIINVDLDHLRVEAVATSFWFGFKDDVLIQVRDYDNRSLAEIRSVSRVGLSDLGKNATRIRKILDELNQN